MQWGLKQYLRFTGDGVGIVGTSYGLFEVEWYETEQAAFHRVVSLVFDL